MLTNSSVKKNFNFRPPHSAIARKVQAVPRLRRETFAENGPVVGSKEG
jgi:hypothetical protein